MPFKPGQSGNPSGLRKATAEEKELQALARSYCAEAIETLHLLMKLSPNHAIRKAAADSLLDRGIGRPVQAVVGVEDAPAINLHHTIEFLKNGGDSAA